VLLGHRENWLSSDYHFDNLNEYVNVVDEDRWIWCYSHEYDYFNDGDNENIRFTWILIKSFLTTFVLQKIWRNIFDFHFGFKILWVSSELVVVWWSNVLLKYFLSVIFSYDEFELMIWLTTENNIDRNETNRALSRKVRNHAFSNNHYWNSF